ncbi:hypothetical protein R6Q59_007179 [Mikania micrantha]
MADVAGYHGGDEGDEPLHGHPYKMPTSYESCKLLNYFDLQQYHNTKYWDGIKLGIQADHANWHKDRKAKLKKHFDKEGGYEDIANRSEQWYGSYHGTQSYAQRRYDEVKEGGLPQHVEGWRDMYFKESSGWYNQLAEQHWDNITDELNKAKSASGGDDTSVDEAQVLDLATDEA